MTDAATTTPTVAAGVGGGASGGSRAPVAAGPGERPGTPATGRSASALRSVARWVPRLRQAALAVIAVVLVCAVWEAYKALGSAEGTRLFGVPVLPRTTDTAMPHTWEVLTRLTEPELAARSDRTLAEAVASAVWFTLRVALAGFAAGVVVGSLLALAMQRLKIVERGLLPYVVASQTVPLVALAPLVASWGGRLEIGGFEWEPWMSVSLIAAYLAFFPVAVGMLRGLQSPSDESLELMHSYAASPWQTLLRLRLPASVPYLVPALKLGGASAVVGAIVAEISTGTKGGIGRLIISYAQSASSNATKLYAAVLGAAAAGLLVAALVGLIDVMLARGRRATGRAS